MSPKSAPSTAVGTIDIDLGKNSGTWDRRVLLQRQVRPSLVVIFLVRIEQMAQMPFAEHDNMVKTIPSDRTDQPLRIPVLPWAIVVRSADPVYPLVEAAG